MKFIFFCIIINFACSTYFASAQPSAEFEIALSGGRVIDPETKLDTIRNVGILNGRIVEILSNTLMGKQTIYVSGKVLVPGFVDLNAHGRRNKEQECQVHDGVTAALEFEHGMEFLSEWYSSRQSKVHIDYGESAHWVFARFLTMKDNKSMDNLVELQQLTSEGDWHIETMLDHIQPSYNNTLSVNHIFNNQYEIH